MVVSHHSNPPMPNFAFPVFAASNLLANLHTPSTPDLTTFPSLSRSMILNMVQIKVMSWGQVRAQQASCICDALLHHVFCRTNLVITNKWNPWLPRRYHQRKVPLPTYALVCQGAAESIPFEVFLDHLKGTNFALPTAEKRHVLCVGVGGDRTHAGPLQNSGTISYDS
jgi:hypothetical protein